MLNYLSADVQGRFYVGAGGAQAPQMLASPPPPNILFPTAKIRVLKSRLFLYSGEINTRVS